MSEGPKPAGKILALLARATEGPRWIWATVLALALVRLAHQCVKFLAESPFIDLAYYYFHASMIRMGLDPFRAADVAAARALLPMRIAGGEVWYPPSFFVLFQPLTLIPFGLLKPIWLAASLGLVAAACLAALREGERAAAWELGALAFLLVAFFQPLYEDLALGQTNTALLFFAAGAWWGWRRGRPALAGVCLAAMAFLKTHYGFLIALALLLGRFRAFLVAAAAWLALFAVGLLQLGPAFYRNYFAAFARQLQLVGGYAHNISPNGVLQRMLGEGHPAATLLHLALSLALLAWVLRRCRGAAPEHQMLCGLTLLPLVSPYTEEHHLVPTLLPLLAAARGLPSLPAPWRAAFVAAAVAIASRYSLIRFEPLPAWLAPLAGLKMAGVFLLLALLLRLAPAAAPSGAGNLPRNGVAR